MKLLSVLENTITEIGDLKNVNSYFKTKWDPLDFKTDEGLEVTVRFERFSKHDLDVFKLSNYINPITYKDGQAENVGFSLGSQHEESQFKKTSYSVLIKILKTVSDKIKNHISEHPHVKYILFTAGNKDKALYLYKEDPQKSKLFRTIVANNISQLPEWSFKDIQISFPGAGTRAGILMFKK